MAVLRQPIDPRRPRGLYVRVLVWENRTTLRSHLKATNYSWSDTVACCCSHRSGAVIATIHLTKRDLDVDTIVHESFHATLGWARRSGLALEQLSTCAHNFRVEEKMALVVSRLAEGIMAKLYRRGFWT